MKVIARHPIVIDATDMATLKSHLMNTSSIEILGAFLKVLSDPTRIRILDVLQQKQLCVADIAVILDMTHSAISHQLSILKDKRLVTSSRVGKMIVYKIFDDRTHRIFTQILEQVGEKA